MEISIRWCGADQFEAFLGPMSVAAGFSVTPERAVRFNGVPEFRQRWAAYDGEQIIGSAGGFSFEMTVPGDRTTNASGLTLVAVLPTHRRRGVLRSLMRRYLDEAHAAGQCVSALFASEAAIYRRFGYGMAVVAAEIEIDRDRSNFADSPVTDARFRLLTESQAREAFPPIWDRVRVRNPGLLARSEAWWCNRVLQDLDRARFGGSAKQYLLCEIQGKPAGYAVYRHPSGAVSMDLPSASLAVQEAVADTSEAVHAVWRYLFDIDLMKTIKASLLPIDHPLLFLVSEPKRLRMRIGDALWLRLVDVGAALSARGFLSNAPIVLDVRDDFCAWNTGRWKLADGRAQRTEENPDLRLDVHALGSLYLGAYSPSQLAAAGLIQASTVEALPRADEIFRAARAPSSPDVF